MRKDRKPGHYYTSHRLLRKIIILHPLHPRPSRTRLQHPQMILQDDPPHDAGVPLQDSLTLLPIPPTDIHEDGRVRLRAPRELALEGHEIEPGWKGGELGLHEAVEGALLDGVGFQPGVEIVGAAVLANLEGGAGVEGVAEGLVQGIEGGEAVVVTMEGIYICQWPSNEVGKGKPSNRPPSSCGGSGGPYKCVMPSLKNDETSMAESFVAVYWPGRTSETMDCVDI